MKKGLNGLKSSQRRFHCEGNYVSFVFHEKKHMFAMLEQTDIAEALEIP